MTRLLLIRHAESTLGAQGRYAGHRDPPLSPRGRRQAMRLARRLGRLDAIYSSDLTRCRQTAGLIAGGRPIILSRSLREMHFGRWEGLTYAECARRFPRLHACWVADPDSFTPPDGEPLRRMARRVRRFARAAARRHPGAVIALVTHGGPIRVLTRSLEIVEPASLRTVDLA